MYLFSVFCAGGLVTVAWQYPWLSTFYWGPRSPSVHTFSYFSRRHLTDSNVHHPHKHTSPTYSRCITEGSSHPNCNYCINYLVSLKGLLLDNYTPTVHNKPSALSVCMGWMDVTATAKIGFSSKCRYNPQTQSKKTCPLAYDRLVNYTVTSYE